MTWEEFLKALKTLGIDLENPPSLFMSGVAGDNGTRYLENQKGVELENNEALFSVSEIEGHDFIWNGNIVRAHGKWSSGGHPALAGFDTICCAGRIKKGYFFFHSGHYHPTLAHALHFFADFVINTCRGMGGVARDRKVAELCVIRLKLYVDGSEEETYSTCFAELAGYGEPQSSSISMSSAISSPMAIGSRPMMIGKSKPMTINNSNSSAFSSGRDISPRGRPSSTGTTLMNSNTTTTSTTTTTTTTTIIPDNPGSLFAETGINTYGRHQLQVRVHGAPPWIDNSARTKCALCSKTFGTFTLKHHCRRCGEIICNACSSHRKAVAHPAVNPKAETPETGQLRVCDRCFRTQDLL